MQSLVEKVAEGLSGECVELGNRWRTQARAVAPRAVGVGVAADADHNAALCQTIAAALHGGARHDDEVMRAGWEAGVFAYDGGSSLHHLLKEFDLLSAMLLYAAQRVAADSPEASAAEGIAVARRISRTVSLLVLAASKGFMHAYLSALQQRSRTLRHDLRNPLGTIKGVVSLMEDPTVTAEMRNDPRFRTMVARNATTLDTMIGDRLSDAATLGPALTRHDVSLRDVALAVRRDLRDQAAEAECAVEVATDLPVVRTDSISFELALRSLIAAALSDAPRGSTVHVALRQLRDKAATVAVAVETPGPTDERPGGERLGFARELSTLTGGKVWDENGAFYLEVPVSAAELSHDRARAD